ncbi:hypothetical protein JCM9279_005127 [Rhodotorula babjevae]
MSRALPAHTASTPPADGTCLFDRTPNEVINIIVAHVCPSTTLVFFRDGPLPGQHDAHTLLALRSTCHLFQMLCQPFMSAVYDGLVDRVDAAAQRLLRFLEVPRSRARRCRKVVFQETSIALQQRLRRDEVACGVILPNVDEVVLSGTDTFNLAYLAHFPRLAHLTIEHTRFFDNSPGGLVLPHLTSLSISTAKTKEPWLLSKATMPTLRHLAIRNSRFEPPPPSGFRAATDLLEQLDVLEIGEDRSQGANNPRRGPLFSSRCAYVRLGRVDAYHANSRDPRDARLTRLGIILSTLPELKLVLVPADFWLPPPTPPLSSRATATQQGLELELERRGVALRFVTPGEVDGITPEFVKFLREREHGTAASSGRGAAAGSGSQRST